MERAIYSVRKDKSTEYIVINYAERDQEPVS